MRRIVQMLPVLSYGDAIGNDVIALDKILRENGYPTEIYAMVIDRRLYDSGVRLYKEYVDDPDAVILYHLSTGEKMNAIVSGYAAHLVIIYHNITPGEFFSAFDVGTMTRCDRGYRSAKRLAEYAEYAIADSDYNRRDLIKMGYECPIETVPILIAFADYEKEPDAGVLSRYSDDGYVNILFTGRVAPNKKHEDLINAFYHYHKYINEKSRLFLVGRFDPTDGYYTALREYTDRLGAENVIFTGHTSFSEILAYYRIADVFLCLSEHEGFCVPLVEAMYFDVPVIAYDAAAVAETLGNGGLLLSEKDPRVVAEAINRVVTDEGLRGAMIESGRARLGAFSHEAVGKRFLETLGKYLDGLE